MRLNRVAGAIAQRAGTPIRVTMKGGHGRVAGRRGGAGAAGERLSSSREASIIITEGDGSWRTDMDQGSRGRLREERALKSQMTDC